MLVNHQKSFLMPKHNVYINLPEREIGNADAHFTIFQNDEILGKIKISKGGIDYYPNKKKIPIKINWTQFDSLIKSSVKR